MKPIYLHAAGALALTMGLAACIPSPRPQPVPSPTPAPAATVTPQPGPSSVVLPTASDWIDRPQTRGNWTYSTMQGGTMASFGEGNDRLFALICDSTSGRVMMRRERSAAGADRGLTIRTETLDRALAAGPDSAGRASTAAVSANDPLLDAIALTRGRFAVEATGTPSLYLPAWGEVTRVIEDCR